MQKVRIHFQMVTSKYVNGRMKKDTEGENILIRMGTGMKEIGRKVKNTERANTLILVVQAMMDNSSLENLMVKVFFRGRMG